MGNKALSETQVRNLKPRERPYKISDGGWLNLHVMPTGGKLWRLGYRFGDKEKTLSLGAYPAVSLADARKGREQAKADLAAGLDPALTKAAKPSADPSTAPDFKTVATRWFEARKGPWGAGHRTRVWGSIKNDILPELGHLVAAQVEPADCLRALRRFEKRGSIEMGRRTRSYLEDIFRYAKAEELVTSNPAVDLLPALSKPNKVKHFAKFKANQMPEFLRRLRVYQGDERTGLAVRLTLLTLVRTTETRFSRWSEFENWDGKDTSKAVWRLSPERMKMDREHLVPLPSQAIDCLHALKKLSRKKDDLIFASPTRSGVISENAMLFVLYSLGYHSKATIHGLRGTASTILNENEFNSDWIEFQLAHTDEDEVRSSYNSAEWLPQRRKMLQWWGDWLDTAETKADLIG